MADSLVPIFSHSGYQWHLTTYEQHLAAPKNDEVFQITFGKGFNAMVTVRGNYLGLEKQAFRRNYLTIFGAQVSSKSCLKL